MKVSPTCSSKAHVARAGEAKKGYGVDRHLFALKSIAAWKQRRLSDIQYEYPAMLADPNLAKLSTSVISTRWVQEVNNTAT